MTWASNQSKKTFYPIFHLFSSSILLLFDVSTNKGWRQNNGFKSKGEQQQINFLFLLKIGQQRKKNLSSFVINSLCFLLLKWWKRRMMHFYSSQNKTVPLLMMMVLNTVMYYAKDCLIFYLIFKCIAKCLRILKLDSFFFKSY